MMLDGQGEVQGHLVTQHHDFGSYILQLYFVHKRPFSSALIAFSKLLAGQNIIAWPLPSWETEETIPARPVGQPSLNP